MENKFTNGNWRLLEAKNNCLIGIWLGQITINFKESLAQTWNETLCSQKMKSEDKKINYRYILQSTVWRENGA